MAGLKDNLSNTITEYEANQPYEFSPLVPHLNRPIPSLNPFTDQDGTEVIQFKGIPFSAHSEEYGDPHFVAEISNCQPLKIETKHWEYKQKTSAQAILPFLFIGSMTAARNARLIQSEQITMLVAVRDGNSALVNPKIMDPSRFPTAHGLETVTFDVTDELDFVRRFRPILRLMNDHLHAKTLQRPVTKFDDVRGKILVFCEAGDKRSAALVTVYLMAVFGLTATSAIQAVQARRFSINITRDFYQIISSCEDMLQAERDTAMCSTHCHTNTAASAVVSHKRQFDAVQEQDARMTPLNNGMFPERVGIAPFRDSYA